MEDYIMNNILEIEHLVQDLLKKGTLIPAEKMTDADKAIGTMLQTAVQMDYNADEGYYNEVIFHDDDDTYCINLRDTVNSARVADIIHKVTGSSRRNSNRALEKLVRQNTSNGYYMINLKVDGAIVPISLHKLICCMTCGENKEVYTALTHFKYKGKGKRNISLNLNHTAVRYSMGSLIPIRAAAAMLHPHFMEVVSTRQNFTHQKYVKQYKRYLADNIILREITYKDSISLYGMINRLVKEETTDAEIITAIDNYYRCLDRQPELYFK